MAERAEILAACSIPAPFDVDGVLVTVRSLAYVPPNDLIVNLTASIDDLIVYDPDEDFIFRNPPIMVPDGGTRTEEHPTLGTVEIPTFEVAPDSALVIMISDTLRTVLRQ